MFYKILKPLLSLKKPQKTYSFMGKISLIWLLLNVALINLFAYLYMLYDKDHDDSIFRGIKGTKNRTYFDYFYLSVIINSTLGLGEIVPTDEGDIEDKDFRSKQITSRVLICTHIMTSLYFNDILDTYENLKLA